MKTESLDNPVNKSSRVKHQDCEKMHSESAKTVDMRVPSKENPFIGLAAMLPRAIEEWFEWPCLPASILSQLLTIMSDNKVSPRLRIVSAYLFRNLLQCCTEIKAAESNAKKVIQELNQPSVVATQTEIESYDRNTRFGLQLLSEAKGQDELWGAAIFVCELHLLSPEAPEK